MRETREIFIPVPKKRNTHVKIEVNNQEVTRYVRTSKWSKPVTSGIGTFYVKMVNYRGLFTNSFVKGQLVEFYADNTDGTTSQFVGRIDHIRIITSREGQFLEFIGRHNSRILQSSLITYSTTGKPTSEIFKDIVAKLPAGYGFTTTNVGTTTDLMAVEWSYKPFISCLIELCNFASWDWYVNDSLDFHYFEQDSILNTDDAIVEGDTLIRAEDWGVNGYNEVTRVTVMGQSDSGLPIIYTAIDPDETDDIKEVFSKQISANTEQAVQDIADSKLYNYLNIPPQAEIQAFGLESVKPGENIWTIIPRQEVSGQYKMTVIQHLFGSENGGWRTNVTIEKSQEGISTVIEELSNQNSGLIESGNPSKLDYSWLLEFKTDTGVHSNTEITEDILKVTSGTGTWISAIKTLSKTATQCRLSVAGDSLTGARYYISTNGGAIYQEIAKDTLETIPSGLNAKLKIDLQPDTIIKGVAILYS